MKRLILLAIALMLMMLTMTACVMKRSSEVDKGKMSRMVEIEETGTYFIVYDKYTKVMYAVSDGAYSRGNFTLLVDANGNPLLYNEAERSER